MVIRGQLHNSSRWVSALNLYLLVTLGLPFHSKAHALDILGKKPVEQYSFPADKQNKFLCFLEISDKGQPTIKIGQSDGKKVAGKFQWTSPEILEKIKALALKRKKLKSDSSSKGKVQFIKVKNSIIQLKGLKTIVIDCPSKIPSPSPSTSPTPSASPTICGAGATGFDAVSCIFKNRCMVCHATQGTWQVTQEFFLSTGRVTPGNLSGSPLYSYLNGNPEGFGPGLMPKGLPPIPAQEIAAIKNWILGISTDTPKEKFKFACDASRDPSPSNLTRLSRVQYINSLSDLAVQLMGPYNYLLQNPIYTYSHQVPGDSAEISFLSEQVFSSLDQRVLQEHNDAYLRLGTVFADQATSTLELRKQLSGGNCEPSGGTPAGLTCLRNFLQKFLLKAFRRPPTTEELSRYETYFLSRPAALALHDVVVRGLSSPDFLYHLELEGTPVNGRSDLFQLTSYELVNRLYYLFWQRMPDAKGFAVAKDNSVATISGLASLVEYLFNTKPDENIKPTVQAFFDEGLGVNRIEGINVGETDAFNAFALPLAINRNDGFVLVDDMISEIHDYLNYYTWRTPGTYSDLLASDAAFPKTTKLASIYGTSIWQTNADPLHMPANQARGLIGRAILLINGYHTTNPAKRGARVAREILCNELPDPDSTIMNMAVVPPLDPKLTTRERFNAVTSNPVCQGCHGVINGFGFALESYDAIGRFRTEEKIFHENGSLLGQQPVDTAVEVVGLGQVSGPAELNEKVVTSGRAHGCFSQKYFRFAFRRREDLGADGCLLEGLRSRLTTPGSSIKDTLKEIAYLPEFQLRKVAP